MFVVINLDGLVKRHSSVFDLGDFLRVCQYSIFNIQYSIVNSGFAGSGLYCEYTVDPNGAPRRLHFETEIQKQWAISLGPDVGAPFPLQPQVQGLRKD
jgi:hypothetical protein